MSDQNSNLHVVYDGVNWAIAAEGEGRLEVNLEFTKALALATAIGIERRVLLYVHDKDGSISKRVDFASTAIPAAMASGLRLPNSMPTDAEETTCRAGS